MARMDYCPPQPESVIFERLIPSNFSMPRAGWFGKASLESALAFPLSLFLFSGSLSSQAATYNWNQSSPAAYNISTDWTPIGPLGPADTAAVGNSTSATGSVLYNSAGFAYGLNVLQLGQTAGGIGIFNLSAGSFGITNNSSANGLAIGNAVGGFGYFTNSGGSLTIQRNATGETSYRDIFQLGPVAGGTGFFTLNSGTVTCLGGIEIGFGGVGTLTVNGGILIDNG